METYHRKRSKRSAISASNEIMGLKRQETSSVLDGAQRQSPPLARQLLRDADYEVTDEEIELGSVYEIYHKNLPLRTPYQLRSTRVVMVSEKTDLNVAIRYPSILSLRTYFSNGVTEMYPSLDEKFVMGTKLARKVLLRQVPSQEFAEKKHLEGFWLVKTNTQFGSQLGLKNEDIGVARELKNNMIRWGVRRQVMFIGKHKESSINTQSSSSFVQGEEEVKIKQLIIKKDECQEDEEVEDQEENDDETEDDTLESTRILRKRKKGKQVNHLNKKPMKKCRKLAIRDPTDRWSKERYMAAELSLLEAMKEKKAMIGNPITRPALRVEARKRIGDTGLLDHLLKHVANKVAPGGTLRFRRSHNADGAMEYWLESADLLKIRKDAGIKDPFWIPPPGWMPGDSPVQDPIVAKEINKLKDAISNIKRDHEEELGKLRREIQELTSKKDKNDLALIVSEQVDHGPKQLTDLFNFMLDSSDVHREKVNKIIADFLKKLQAEVAKQTTQMDAESTELITATVPNAQKESAKQKAAEKNEGEAVTESGRKVEGKAAKIERLKSGFRLFRPQGTFLWPDMVNPSSTSTTSSVSSQVEDLLVVPTPPSVNSSTPPHHHYHHHHLSLVPPVKPVPQRRPLTVVTPLDLQQSHPSTTITINLNDIPTTSSQRTSLNYCWIQILKYIGGSIQEKKRRKR